jgi:hypothetical protein
MFAEKIFGVPWIVVSVLALAIAVVFLMLDLSGGGSGLAWLGRRWLHGICWLFLAAAALVMTRLLPIDPALAQPLAAAGGASYALFLVASFVLKDG